MITPKMHGESTSEIYTCRSSWSVGADRCGPRINNQHFTPLHCDRRSESSSPQEAHRRPWRSQADNARKQQITAGAVASTAAEPSEGYGIEFACQLVTVYRAAAAALLLARIHLGCYGCPCRGPRQRARSCC